MSPRTPLSTNNKKMNTFEEGTSNTPQLTRPLRELVRTPPRTYTPTGPSPLLNSAVDLEELVRLRNHSISSPPPDSTEGRADEDMPPVPVLRPRIPANSGYDSVSSLALDAAAGNSTSDDLASFKVTRRLAGWSSSESSPNTGPSSEEARLTPLTNAKQSTTVIRQTHQTPQLLRVSQPPQRQPGQSDYDFTNQQIRYRNARRFQNAIVQNRDRHFGFMENTGGRGRNGEWDFGWLEEDKWMRICGWMERCEREGATGFPEVKDGVGRVNVNVGGGKRNGGGRDVVFGGMGERGRRGER